MTPAVSVIVPAHEITPGLRSCLVALADQEYPADRFEIIVVFNGARAPAENPFSDQDPLRVRFVHEPRPGSYAARNRGLAVARGDVLAFTDADCVPHRDWVAKGVVALTRGDADIVAGDVRVTFARGEPRDPVSLFERCFAFRQDNYVRWGFAATANLATLRHVVETTGPFEDRLLSAGDVEWCLRARRLGFRVRHAPEVAVAHPARTTYRALISKARRLEGGIYSLRRLHPSLVLPRQLSPKPVDLIYPGRVVRRILEDKRLQSARERIALLLVVQVVRAARVIERQRLRLGGSPLRY